MRFPRFRHRQRDTAAPAGDAAAASGAAAAQMVELHIDPSQLGDLSSVFSAPRWMRDLGFASWLLAGVALLLFGLVWMLGAISTIADPVLAGLVVATVASPAVARLQARGVPRLGGTILILLLLVAIAIVIALLVLGGIYSQANQISSEASAAASRIQGWVRDAGVSSSGAATASSSAQSATPQVLSTLVHGVGEGIRGLTSLAFFISFTFFSLFFTLKDGPAFRGWIEGHLPVPSSAARVIVGGVIAAMRRYFLGLTIVAVFNGVVVGVGALLLGVPLAGTIAVVTLVTAYVPFIGAFVSGAFAVLLALGSQGTGTAAAMLVIVILANGGLQNIVQPIAFGATLNINPLLALVVTIAAGCFFGMLGMILAAPLTSAAIHVSRALSEAERQREAAVAARAAAPAEAD
ncbi:MAG TPA: AI-2E family transporter [Gaiellales bacterium]|nr:AI-2E family transporter [Gaiellales bacterium]